MVGPNTLAPITAFSKAQSCVSHSSTESELVALDQCIRSEAVPITWFWEQVLPVLGCHYTIGLPIGPNSNYMTSPPGVLASGSKPEVVIPRHEKMKNTGDAMKYVRQGHPIDSIPLARIDCVICEDNQPCIKTVSSGKTQLRYLQRTQAICLDYITDLLKLDNFSITYVDTKAQIADLFTKGMTVKDTWDRLIHLLGVSYEGGSTKGVSVHRACAVRGSSCGISRGFTGGVTLGSSVVDVVGSGVSGWLGGTGGYFSDSDFVDCRGSSLELSSVSVPLFMSGRDSSGVVSLNNTHSHDIRNHFGSRSARLCACIPHLSKSLTQLASSRTLVLCHQRLPSPLECTLSSYLQRAHFAAMACPNEDGSVQIVPPHILELKALSNNPSLPAKDRLTHRKDFYTACKDNGIFMPPPHQSTPPAYPNSVQEEWNNAELCDRMGLLPPVNITHFSDFDKNAMKIVPWIRAMLFGDVAKELGLTGDEINLENILSKKRLILRAVHPDCNGRTHSMNTKYACFCASVVESGISRFGTQEIFREFWNPRSKSASAPPGGPDLPFAERPMCSGCFECRCPCGTPARLCATHQVKLERGGDFVGYQGCPQDVEIDLGMTTEGSTKRTYRQITMLDTPPSTWKQWFSQRYRFMIDNPYSITEPDRSPGQGPGRFVGQANPDVAGMAPVTPAR